MFASGDAMQNAYCNDTEMCTDVAEEIDETTATYTIRCNLSETEEWETMYTVNYIWW